MNIYLEIRNRLNFPTSLWASQPGGEPIRIAIDNPTPDQTAKLEDLADEFGLEFWEGEDDCGANTLPYEDYFRLPY
jgi:hypothetical protein